MHVYWDPQFGASLGFDDPFADLNFQRKWSPYSSYSTCLTVTAVFNFHDMKAVGVVNPRGDGVDLRFQVPDDRRVVMANRMLPWEKTESVWLQAPDGAQRRTHELLPKIDRPEGVIPTEFPHDYERLRPGGYFHGFSRSLLFGNLRGSMPLHGYTSENLQAWQLLLPVPIPLAQLPQTVGDLRAEWWHVTFDPSSGPRFRRFDG